ncbi:hypothetical protein DAPPUDRAFT_115011 [Daphnia pulex]|uniref:Uncharacterized protein n=1 Tax=Daphnia pulex TaxID=6669 RepID=E9HJX7_DAPPU|nr:hypothetical protein DAPPUDRAFT_115011 [Daphnia pulex]|eukprot:EFX67963.1 hypothetical protein DAPPUDRAFT_115011 [Daphnia pulex]
MSTGETKKFDATFDCDSCCLARLFNKDLQVNNAAWQRKQKKETGILVKRFRTRTLLMDAFVIGSATHPCIQLGRHKRKVRNLIRQRNFDCSVEKPTDKVALFPHRSLWVLLVYDDNHFYFLSRFRTLARVRWACFCLTPSETAGNTRELFQLSAARICQFVNHRRERVRHVGSSEREGNFVET